MPLVVLNKNSWNNFGVKARIIDERKLIRIALIKGKTFAQEQKAEDGQESLGRLGLCRRSFAQAPFHFLFDI